MLENIKSFQILSLLKKYEPLEALNLNIIQENLKRTREIKAVMCHFLFPSVFESLRCMLRQTAIPTKSQPR